MFANAHGTHSVPSTLRPHNRRFILTMSISGNGHKANSIFSMLFSSMTAAYTVNLNCKHYQAETDEAAHETQ
jgi:hypothetical protein